MMTISGEVIRALREDGYAVIPPSAFSLDDDSVDELRREVDILFDEGRYETGLYPDEIHWRPGISRPDVTREICNAWKSSRVVADVVCREELGELACRLMGWTCSRIAQDDVLYKPPPPPAPSSSGEESNESNVRTRVGFHQDGSYISTNFVPLENNSITMWIALDDADADNGAIQYAPGSHRWRETEAKNDNKITSPSSSRGRFENVNDVDGISSFHVGENDDYLRPLRVAASDAGLDPEQVIRNQLVTVPVKKGQMVVHHQWTWHGSGPNNSGGPADFSNGRRRPRRAIVAHLLNGEVQWKPVTTRLPHYIYGRYYIRGESVPREDFFPFTYASDEVRERKGIRRTRWLDDGSP